MRALHLHYCATWTYYDRDHDNFSSVSDVAKPVVLYMGTDSKQDICLGTLKLGLLTVHCTGSQEIHFYNHRS